MKQNFPMAITAAPWALEGAPVLLCGPLPELFQKAQSLGYDAIELHLCKPEDAPVQEILKLSKETGVQIAAVATGLAKLVDKLCFIDDDPAIRAAAVERVKQFIDWAAAIGTGIVIGSLRGTIPDKKHREVPDERIRSCFNDILAYNADKHVPLYLEAINRYENNYLNTAQEMLAFVESFHSKDLFVHLDTFHMNIEETNIPAAIKQAGSRLGHIHLADNNRHACGDGALDFGSILHALADIGYSGYLSVECLPLPDGETAAANTITYINNCL